MLRIRPEQIDALAVQQTESFAVRMAAHLRQDFPAEVESIDDDRLRLLVHRVRELAERWSIVQETHVERLLELFVSFDALRLRPMPESLAEIVEFPGRPGDEILLRLEETLLFGDRR